MKSLLLAGANVIIDAKMRRTDELTDLAYAAQQSQAQLTLRNLGIRRQDELMSIAHAGKDRVVIDFFADD